jgi:tetratricopeptide (TPR) repeat protein
VADPDEWRNRLREAVNARDRDPGEVERLIASTPAGDWPAPTLGFLNKLAFKLTGPARQRAGERVLVLLREAQRRHPDDFWINYELGFNLFDLPPRPAAEAIRFFSAAVAIRPQSPGAHNSLGSALYAQRRLDDAMAEYRQALRLHQDFSLAHRNLGNALRERGELDEAVAEFRAALRLQANDPNTHNQLGLALHDKGQVDEAMAEYREAVRLDEDHPWAHYNLGNALRDKG